MKIIERKQTEYNGKPITLYSSSFKGKRLESATVREALLYAWGYGTDQAAELRYMMRKTNPTKA